MSNEFVQSMFGYDGQVVVVIGGTGVLGGAICEGFAQAGATVVVAGRSEERGQERAEAITTGGGTASFIQVNATERASVQALCEQTVEQFGRVDVLVNCAGVNSAAPYEEITDEDWDKVISTNLTATQLGCQIFATHMSRTEDGGSILNIGSVTSDRPLSRVYAYSASKAAVLSLTKNVGREYATKGVRVNALCPGFFPAEQNRKILQPERVAKIMDQTPMTRFGEPHELVGACLLLCSRNAGSFITSAEIYVDGGFTGSRL